MYFLIKRLIRIWRSRQAQRVAAAPAAAVTEAPPVAFAARPNGRSAASRGMLALFLHQAGSDLKVALRSPRARFMGFLFPVILLVVFNSVWGHTYTRVDGVRVKLDVFYLPGIMAMAIITQAYAGLVITISGLRESGVLKRRRAAPVPASVLIGGQALATVVTTAMTSAILLIVAKLGFGVGMSAPAIVAVACTAAVGTLAFSCIGYAVSGLIGSQDAAQPVVQMTMLPLWFISGVFIPVQNLGRGLKDLADVFPVQHLANSLHLASVHTSFGSSLSAMDLVVLAVWAVGAAALAAWRFSWLPSAA